MAGQNSTCIKMNLPTGPKCLKWKKAVNQAPVIDIINFPMCVFTSCMYLYVMLYAVLNEIQYYFYVECRFTVSYFIIKKRK